MLRRDLFKATALPAALSRPAIAAPAPLLKFVPQPDVTVTDPGGAA